jgi:DNA-binding NarL/FixJ family response regulator
MPNMSILVLEDVALVRERIVNLISEIAGIDEVLEAQDAASAWSLFERHRPRVVVLDISVPGIPGLKNGIDVLKRIRKEDARSFIIMLTNYDTPQYRTECLKAGATYFFDKSSQFEQLPSAVEQLLHDPAS